jgi:hypothetical protein
MDTVKNTSKIGLILVYKTQDFGQIKERNHDLYKMQ